jgi:hypothetical protein
MLTPRHRALFDASYSALLLRSNPIAQTPPPQPPSADPGQTAPSNRDKDFGDAAKLE